MSVVNFEGPAQYEIEEARFKVNLEDLELATRQQATIPHLAEMYAKNFGIELQLV